MVKISVDTIKINLAHGVWRNCLIENGFNKKRGKDFFGSYYYKRFRAFNIKRFIGSHITQVELSVPKFMYGSNAIAFDLKDTEAFFERLNNEVANVLGRNQEEIQELQATTDFRNANVSELHVFKDFRYKNTKEEEIYMDAYKRLPAENRLNKDVRKTSAILFNKSTRITQYKKIDEMEHRNDLGKCTKLDKAILISYKERGIGYIRNEVQSKSTCLEYLVVKNFLKDRKLSTVLSQDVLDLVYNKSIEKTELQYKFATRSKLLKEIRKSSEINSNKNVNKIIRFLDAFNGLNKCNQDSFSKEEYRDYKKIVNRMGYSIVYLKELKRQVNTLKVRVTGIGRKNGKFHYTDINEGVECPFEAVDIVDMNGVNFGFYAKRFFDTS